MVLELEVVKTSGRSLGTLTIAESKTVRDLKQEIAVKFSIAPERQSIRNASRGKDESDSTPIIKVNVVDSKIYVKDLGPQIGWDTVFFLEYAGPIFLYGLLFLYPNCFYLAKSYVKVPYDQEPQFPFNMFPLYQINQICGGNPNQLRINFNSYVAAVLWTVHYGKRILETAFVHRFSHGTMPIFNLFKNCGYYWGFALYVAYHINHPLHTPPSQWLFIFGAVMFIICELGNLSIHLLLRDLRPPGTNIRKIPVPNSNPLTQLFNYVSCPNYTYEFGSWIGFALLTGCLPVLIFALAGFYQMTMWAIGKHKKYIKEFPNYPKKRAAILPFLL